MTEAEWRACDDPHAMLRFLRGRVSARKLRLFAVACCRRITNLLDARGLTALDVAERFADGLADEGQLKDAESLAEEAFNDFDHVREYAAEAVIAACAQDDLELYAWRAAWLTKQLIDVGVSRQLIKAARRFAHRQECHWLRDMLSPFRPDTRAVPALRGTVTRWAGLIYDERAFDQLPILADALEDAGCADAALLGHLRSPGPHVRGCWALDLVLGKS